MLIDCYTHIAPAAFTQAMSRIVRDTDMIDRMLKVKPLHDLDTRFRIMDRCGDYRQVIASTTPPVETFTTEKQGVELTHIVNDAMAELVQRHPDRFAAFIAALPMHSIDAALAELGRLAGLGARGVQLFTSVNGKALDDQEFRPLFAAIAEQSLPIWLHPCRTSALTDYQTEPRSRYEMWWCFGWPYETSVAMTRLALSGVFDRHPGLVILTHHLGGMVPFYDKRIEHGLAVLGARTADEDYSQVLSSLRKPLIDYLRTFYADTALSGMSPGMACGMSFFGTERVLFASDAPFGPIAETRDAVDALQLDANAAELVMCGNARRILRLPGDVCKVVI